MMTTGYLYTSTRPLSRAEIIAFLKQLTADWSVQAYRYQECLEAVELDWGDRRWADQLSSDPAALSPIGRVFSQEFELRWQMSQPDRYETRLLAERVQPFFTDEWAVQQFEAGPEYPIYLWGEFKADSERWTMTRIPHPQRYPVQGEAAQPLVIIQARDYRQDGVVRTTRGRRVESSAKSQPEE